MAIYKSNGLPLTSAHELDGDSVIAVYDAEGTIVFSPSVNYKDYSFTQKWASKGISSTQGFDVYDGKVFWVSKSGNSSADSNCYVWNLSDGSQALDTPYITIYSWHGNNLCFNFPELYASSAYTPNCYINTLSDDFTTATLTKTLALNDGSIDCDACLDESDKTILWTLGHTANSSNPNAPFYISKWDLEHLTDNGNGTYTPQLLQKVELPQPVCFYFQGCKMHDGLIWFASGYAGSSTQAYVYAVNPNIGSYVYTIDCETTSEPEGVAWVSDNSVAGGYALYVGFAGMALRKYIFSAIN